MDISDTILLGMSPVIIALLYVLAIGKAGQLPDVLVYFMVILIMKMDKIFYFSVALTSILFLWRLM